MVKPFNLIIVKLPVNLKNGVCVKVILFITAMDEIYLRNSVSQKNTNGNIIRKKLKLL